MLAFFWLFGIIFIVSEELSSGIWFFGGFSRNISDFLASYILAGGRVVRVGLYFNCC